MKHILIYWLTINCFKMEVMIEYMRARLKLRSALHNVVSTLEPPKKKLNATEH